MIFVCPFNSVKRFPSFAFHTIAVPSVDAVTIFFPSLLNCEYSSQSLCPSNVSIATSKAVSLNFSVLHILAVPSYDAVTIFFPSGLKRAETTGLSCNKLFNTLPVSASQTIPIFTIVLETISLLSGLNSAALTPISGFSTV